MVSSVLTVVTHSASGFFLNQWIHSRSNIRTDEYGGSVESRARFILELVDAVVEAISAERVGIRFSPWSTFQGNGSPLLSYTQELTNREDMEEIDPIPQYSYLVSELAKRHSNLAYLHLVEPRILVDQDADPRMTATGTQASNR